ncbi:hypothetical protein [Pseudomonas sp. D3-10]|uniref:hypothetical protein n=1 Tax=Pseudomonas sp. D3-10 TaxID=2817392 RepID=UPI003DAA0F3E
MSNKIWYLPGPFHQYQEDVKALAKERGLVIIDANVTESREDAAESVPTVTVKESPRVLLVGGGSSSVDIDSFRAELESVGVIVELFADQKLSRPVGELGPIAERLFQVFEAVNAGVLSLRNERDGEADKAVRLAQENADLLDKLATLKAAGGDAEIEAMKAKLSQANVSFRANASREALEKLVAELPQE